MGRWYNAPCPNCGESISFHSDDFWTNTRCCQCGRAYVPTLALVEVKQVDYEKQERE